MTPEGFAYRGGHSRVNYCMEHGDMEAKHRHSTRLILAPLRGVTIRSFREVFADVIRDAGFTEAITPFIAANAGVDPMKNAELRIKNGGRNFTLTPQFIGKDPEALRYCLERVKAAGYETADLNCGCPYPMVRNKGRGSGILRTPEVLEKMLAVGCEVMGAGRFSVKARLGVDRNDELLALMPMLNSFPLRFLTVHPRNARQMYDGECDWTAFDKVASVAKMPLVRNGDIPFPLSCDGDGPSVSDGDRMIGRGFIRYLGERDDIGELVGNYIKASQAELCGDNAVLGRMKELFTYWKELPRWHRLWPVIKIARSVDELLSSLSIRI